MKSGLIIYPTESFRQSKFDIFEFVTVFENRGKLIFEDKLNLFEDSKSRKLP
jgi:hypothetical protein